MKHPGKREIEELKKMITKSIRDKDLPHTRKVGRLWGIATAIGFICQQYFFSLAIEGDIVARFSIYALWTVVITTTALFQKRFYPKPEVVSYISRFYSRFWVLVWTAMAIGVALLMWQQQHCLIGAFIAVLVGVGIGAGGVLFGSSIQIISGIIYMLASLPIAYFWREQFLIFAALQILVLIIGPLFWRTRDE